MLLEAKVKVVKILETTQDVIRFQTNGGAGKAILYRKLHPEIGEGDWVVVNTTATALQLGTGGWDIVRAVITNEKASYKDNLNHGHIMKGRYLGDQHSVLTVEAPESSYHSLFKEKFHLEGRHIFICELHSMLPIIWFYLQQRKIPVPLTVILSDEASLPLDMSNHLAFLKKQTDFLSITTGQSFGGQKESINIATALQFTKKINRKGIILVTQGPGVVGTNTYYGFSSLAQSQWANLIGALGGQPVWIPRLSEADGRERHRGISHHTITPLTELTLVNSVLPTPTGPHSDPWISQKLTEISGYKHITMKKVKEEILLPELKKVQSSSPFPLTSMGRTIDKDPLFFLGVTAPVHWYLEEVVQSFNV